MILPYAKRTMGPSLEAGKRARKTRLSEKKLVRRGMPIFRLRPDKKGERRDDEVVTRQPLCPPDLLLATCLSVFWLRICLQVARKASTLSAPKFQQAELTALPRQKCPHCPPTGAFFFKSSKSAKKVEPVISSHPGSLGARPGVVFLNAQVVWPASSSASPKILSSEAHFHNAPLS